MKCPFCKEEIYGGMTLVRHLVSIHKENNNSANNLVDEIYAMKNPDHSVHINYDRQQPSTYVRLKTNEYGYTATVNEGLPCFGSGKSKEEALAKMIASARKELDLIEAESKIYFEKKAKDKLEREKK